MALLDPTQAMDMDDAGMRLTLDVVGLVCIHWCVILGMYVRLGFSELPKAMLPKKHAFLLVYH